jgi:hypothetical protein
MKVDQRLDGMRIRLGETGYAMFWLLAGAAFGALINFVMLKIGGL